MSFVIQRVKSASVEIGGEISGSIGKGFLVLIGIATDDNKEIADKMIRKLINMRIFDDEAGKTNLALSDVKGELLLVSQFTLYANCKHGNRPSFTDAAKPYIAIPLYEYVVSECKEKIYEGAKIATGIFGADMKVSLLNDGPFTIILDSNEL